MKYEIEIGNASISAATTSASPSLASMKLLALLLVAAVAAAHSAPNSPHNYINRVKSANSAADGANGHETGPRTVIRETTMYYGGKAASPTTQNGSKLIPTAVPAPPANLITSLHQLRPLFDYGIHHPLKFTFHFIVQLVLFLYSYLLLPSLRLLLSPFLFLARPFIALY